MVIMLKWIITRVDLMFRFIAAFILIPRGPSGGHHPRDERSRDKTNVKQSLKKGEDEQKRRKGEAGKQSVPTKEKENKKIKRRRKKNIIETAGDCRMAWVERSCA